MNYLNTCDAFVLFEKAVSGDLYVDKSMLIEAVSKKLHTNDQYLCITRPRRFGKTLNASMLAAYYQKGCDSDRLFQGMQIASSPAYGLHQNRYGVIHIDFSRMPDLCESYRDYVTNILQGLRGDLKEAYPKLKEKEYTQISHMFRDTGDTFVFILDEWDSVFYQKFMSEDDRNAYLLFLKGLLKDQPYVELAYMTGVLPIAKYSSGSELNMFDEYHFMNDTVYDRYFGFDEEEVRALCRKRPGLSYDELEKWYDGYCFSDGKSLFNPRSVTKALTRGICLNYWTETGPMNEIAECIEHNVDEVREDIVKLVAGIPVEAVLNGYSAVEQQLNSRDEILSAMVVYGFLAYHNGILTIPNHELMEKYQSVLTRNSMGEVKEIVDTSQKMLEATLKGDERLVADILESVHDKEIPFLNYNDENSLSCVITLCYLYARKDYQIERELKCGKGYCDYIFLPKNNGKTAVILELKVGGTPEQALTQIKDRQYIRRVKSCREVLLVGISYDEKKRHRCRIERRKHEEYA